MYAIIESGGKQYKVEKGSVIDVELLDSEGEIEFEKVLLFRSEDEVLIGTPHLDKVVVSGKIVDKVAAPKVIAYKYRRRKDSRKKIGHRQKYSRVEIKAIEQVK